MKKKRQSEKEEDGEQKTQQNNGKIAVESFDSNLFGQYD